MLVDSLSYQYLVGSVVDYTRGLDGSRFIISKQMQQPHTVVGHLSRFSRLRY